MTVPATAAACLCHHSHRHRLHPGPRSRPPGQHGGCQRELTPRPSGDVTDAWVALQPGPGLAGVIDKGPESAPTCSDRPLNPRHGGHLQCCAARELPRGRSGLGQCWPRLQSQATDITLQPPHGSIIVVWIGHAIGHQAQC